MRKSILFVNPDYHCSFVYRDELRKLGWKANVYVPESYPKKLLYSKGDITPMPQGPAQHEAKKFAGALAKTRVSTRKIAWLTQLFAAHKYLVFYGGLESLPLLIRNEIQDAPPVSRSIEIAKKLGNKIIQVPSGCLEEETKEHFSQLDGGNVCGNCGWSAEVCNDENNIARFNLVGRYADLVIGQGCFESSRLKLTHFKYKSLDLNLWNPNLEIPAKHRLPKTKNLRVLHSFVGKGRDSSGKNIKGTPRIADAIDRLKAEGYPVEYMFLDDIQSKDMRYYQAQADIAVDQLIYGWWGSTGIEAMGLGKPVVCYLRPAWKDFFLKQFPEYSSLPIVEANAENIYEVLKRLALDHDFRKQKGRESWEFAFRHFDVTKNAPGFIDQLTSL